jgi:hypothetical protein
MRDMYFELENKNKETKNEISNKKIKKEKKHKTTNSSPKNKK